ncbi:LytR/AlgR family response regulator transcription factor [Marinoscillum pacificum]|uniref:LytR/AlgR family response regulator transcription factor n=1 Tax=Marinoscillum pacificum TaxID=392723 RepID=UPI0021578946|nr:LytTR family DNA-binding domain-containing protein [Marinoscillum pacificum]
MGLKVVIIEDEAPAFRRLQKILEEAEPDVEIVEVLDSVEEAVNWISKHEAPDLYFMDIQLSDGISFEIFEKVRIMSPVIFTTAFDEYMLKAFKVNSVDYLLKPIKSEDLKNSLVKLNGLKTHFTSSSTDLHEVVKQIRMDTVEYKSRFLIKLGDKMIAVETNQISYFQTRNGVVHMTTKGSRNYFMDQTLDELETVLNPSKFYRANRQFIVSFDAIHTVHKYHKGKLLVEVTPKSKDEVVVSAEKATKFKQWLDS